ncbi:MAG: hypothetical protein R3E32_28555 [Chitinophagales bacterium]
MRISVIILILFLFTSEFVSAQSLVGKWTAPPAEGQAFEQIILNMAKDGRYTVLTQYGYNLENEYDVGTYSLNGNTLNFFSTRYGNVTKYQLDSFNGNSFNLSHDQLGLTWNYSLRAAGEFDQSELTTLKAWENYRAVEGQWKFPDGMVKFLPAHGLAFIHYNNQLYFGEYGFDGDHLTIKEVSAEKNTIYSGKIHSITAKQYQMVSDADNENTVYNFAGKLELTEDEITLTGQYLTTMHRLNMSIIGSMGNDRMVWKKVDRYGNLID